MKYRFIFILLALTIASCSKIEVGDEELPNVEFMKPTTINTNLPIININADQGSIDNMMTAYYNKVVVSGQIYFFNNPGIPDSTVRNIEFEIKGRSSVGEEFPLKSLGVTFDKPIKASFKNTHSTGPISNHHLEAFSDLRLRSSGNDFGKSMIKDLAYSQLATQAGLDLELMYGAAVQVFLNNNYYGLMNARTESGVIGIGSLINIDPSLISMVKVKDDSENLKFHEGDQSGAQELLSAIKAKDSQGIRDHIDEDNFIDYIIYQDYVGNADWANNIKAYNVSNGKFRFILFDLDLASNASSIALIPKLEFLSADIGKIYRAFQEDENFNSRFEDRKRELYQRFSVQKFNEIVDELAHTIEDDIPFLIAKYGRPESTLHWQIEIEKLKLDFTGRDHFIRKKYDLD